MKKLIKPLILLLIIFAVLVNVDFMILALMGDYNYYASLPLTMLICVSETLIFSFYIKKSNIKPLLPNVIWLASTLIIIYCEVAIPYFIVSEVDPPYWATIFLFRAVPIISLIIATALCTLSLIINSDKKFLVIGVIIASVISLASIPLAFKSYVGMEYNSFDFLLYSIPCSAAHICISIWLNIKAQKSGLKTAVKLNLLWLASTLLVSGVICLIITFIVKGFNTYSAKLILYPLVIYLTLDIIVFAVHSILYSDKNQISDATQTQ